LGEVKFDPACGDGMKLVEALQLSNQAQVAFTGGGGKTTALFRLGRELTAPVFLTTTTHLGLEQVSYADQHMVIQNQSNLELFLKDIPERVILLTGPETPDGRVSGLGPDSLDILHEYCDKNKIPLLIEADGSRGLPLKAPAPHEPNIPAWVTDSVSVAGMNGILKPLDARFVHRPERFAAIAGISLGDSVSVESITKVLLHPDGGLKNIPPHARRIALLNQVDSDELQSQAGRIARALTESYHSVLVGSLKEQGESEISSCYKATAGIILAAGGASRFGQPKPLLEWRGQPFVRRVTLTALEAGLKPVVIVTGNASDAVQNSVEDLPVQTVYNPEWQTGQSSSIKAGINALPPQSGATFFLMADQPQVTSEILSAQLDLYRRTLAPIVAPLIGGKRGNPVLFDQATFPALRSITGDSGGRQVFSQFHVTWLEWNDVSLLLDVDTPEDYQRLLGFQQ
jgi:molybdenum cofactor cytidylyltransferase